MICWLITGAGRGVGKTHLAQKLTTVLPNAVYAKLGRHPPQADKPQNYFTDAQALLDYLPGLSHEHVIIEAHHPTLLDRSDIHIHLNTPQHPNPRDDAQTLHARADIVVPKAPTDDHATILARKHLPRPLIAPICRLLDDQATFITTTSFPTRP